MSAEKLRTLIEKGNYLSLELISDSLVNLLKEVSSLLVDQQRQIDALKGEVGKKIQIHDLTEFKTEVQNHLKEVDQRVLDSDKLLKESNEKVEQNLAMIQSNLQKSFDEQVQNLEHQYSGQISLLESDNDALQERVQRLELALAKLAPTVEQSENSLIDLFQKFDNFEKSESHDQNVAATPSSSSVNLSSGQFEDLSSMSMKGKSVDQIRKMNDVLRRLNDRVEEHTNSIDQINDKLNTPKEENTKVTEDQDRIITNLIEQKMAEINEKVSQIDAKFQEQANKVLSRVERKADTNLVERLFEKLRVLIASLKDDIDVIGKRQEHFVNKKYVEDRIAEEINSLCADEESSLINKPYKCLACGRPKLRITQPNVEVKLTDLPVILLPHQKT